MNHYYHYQCRESFSVNLMLNVVLEYNSTPAYECLSADIVGF